MPDVNTINSILTAVFRYLLGQMIEGALGSIETFLVWWISDTYSVRLNGEPGGVLALLRGHSNWLTAMMAFAGFLIAGIRVAVQRKGEPFRVAFSQFIELAVIVFTLATMVNLANIAGDRYSEWILLAAEADNDKWKENWVGGLEVLRGSQAATLMLLGVFALCAFISTAVQFVLMLFRSGVLIVLVGILPVVAASRFNSYGNHAYKKCVGWLISFILYKPVAATIYAAALKLIQSPHEADRLFGLALVGGAIFALPAILRAVMPAVAEDNSQFGVRQVGHFVFGGTAANTRRAALLSGTRERLRRRRSQSDEGPAGATAPVGNRPQGGGTPGGGTPGGRAPGGGTPGGGGTGAGSGGPSPGGGQGGDGPGGRSGNRPWHRNRTSGNPSPTPSGTPPTGGAQGGGPGGHRPGGSLGGSPRRAGNWWDGESSSLRMDGPRGGDPTPGPLPPYQVPDYQVPDPPPIPDYQVPDPPPPPDGGSRPGYTPPSLRDAINENLPDGSGGTNGPSGAGPT